MRKLLFLNALWAMLLTVLSVDVATAGVNGPNEYGGHGSSQCEAPTHLTYYDPRYPGQGIYDTDRPNGDNTFYVDTDPTAGFRPDGNYGANSPNRDCDGTPVLRVTAYAAVTFSDQDGTIHVGYPKCTQHPDDTRNPSCNDTHTGASGAFYVASGDNSIGVGKAAGVTPFYNG